MTPSNSDSGDPCKAPNPEKIRRSRCRASITAVATILTACVAAVVITGAVVGVHKVKARLWSANSHASSTPLITNFTETLHFVVRNGSQLQVDGHPFYFAGWNNYYLPQYSADPNGMYERADDVDVAFRDAQSLGLTVLRTWAFNDGNQWNSMQPSMGVMDERVLREGLDYVVWKARESGMRTVLTLTNYQPAFGGALQWVQWMGGSSITDFYTSPTIRRAFKEYVVKILLRRNSITGQLYKDDASILAWDLINEPYNPGDSSGQVITAWAEDMAAFVKGLAPNHLIMLGTIGMFGASTPALTKLNPFDLVGDTTSKGGIYSADPVCQGEDFSSIVGLRNVDIGSVHVYLESWPICTQTCEINFNGQPQLQLNAQQVEPQGMWTLCSQDCRLQFMRRWVRLHIQECARLGKVLVVEEFGAKQPMAVRNAVYSAMYQEISSAISKGLPAAGSMLWMLAAPSHKDFDNFTVYSGPAAYQANAHVKRGVPPPVVTWDSSTGPDYYNNKAYWQCAAAHLPPPANGTGFGTLLDTNGWNDTLTIIRGHSAAMAALSKPHAALTQ